MTPITTPTPISPKIKTPFLLIIVHDNNNYIDNGPIIFFIVFVNNLF